MDIAAANKFGWIRQNNPESELQDENCLAPYKPIRQMAKWRLKLYVWWTEDVSIRPSMTHMRNSTGSRCSGRSRQDTPPLQVETSSEYIDLFATTVIFTPRPSRDTGKWTRSSLLTPNDSRGQHEVGYIFGQHVFLTTSRIVIGFQVTNRWKEGERTKAN